MTNTIYALLDPTTNELRYIGKTTNLKQRLTDHLKARGNTHKANWIRKLKADGYKPDVLVIEETSLGTADESEVFWIAYFKSIGCRLTNSTTGGEGLQAGHKMSADTRLKMSQAHTGQSRDTETVRKIAAANRGQKRSQEAVERMRKAQQGKQQGESQRAKAAVNSSRWYIVTTPTGSEVEVFNLSDFCKANHLDYRSMLRTLSGQYRHHKGHTVRPLEAA